MLQLKEQCSNNTLTPVDVQHQKILMTTTTSQQLVYLPFLDPLLLQTFYSRGCKSY